MAVATATKKIIMSKPKKFIKITEKSFFMDKTPYRDNDSTFWGKLQDVGADF